MRKLLSQGTFLAVVVIIGVAASGCSKVNMLRAKAAFKNANTQYQAMNYKSAAEKYEQVVALDPSLVDAYFFLGNSYDNLYNSAKKGDPVNDAFLTKAIENYRKASETEHPQSPTLKTLSLQYLIAAYSPDKADDPQKAMEIIQRMIQINPKDLTSYYQLAQLYESGGDYDMAEATLLKAKEINPNDGTVYAQLAAFYGRQGDFDKTIEALNQRVVIEPNNPEAHHTIATYYWDEVYKNFKLKDADKKKYLEAGIAASDKAIALKDDYYEAITYKNLLLRQEALLEKDPARQQALLKQADQLRDRAQELQKQQKAAAAAPTKG